MINAFIENWKLIISYLIGVIIVIVLYREIAYRLIVPEIIGKILYIIIMLVPVVYVGFTCYSNSNYNSVVDSKAVREFKSNQDSEYSQLWLDYLSFRDAEIGRLGSDEKFRAFLESKGMSEREYAIEVIKDMLAEQGIEDLSIAEDCVSENIVGSLE